MEPGEGQFSTQTEAGTVEAGSVDVPPEKKKPTEREHREELLRRYVENRVISLDPDFEEEDLSEAFAGISIREKTDILYEKLMARYKALEAIRGEERLDPEAKPEAIDPYLISEIKTL